MGRTLEKFFPFLVGAIALALYVASRGRIPFSPPEALRDLFAAIINVSAIAVGFLATAKSILVSLEDKPIVRMLKDAGYYSDLVRYLMTATQLCFGLAIASALLVLLDFKTAAFWNHFAFGVWVFLTATAATACARVIRVFGRVLEHRN